ncbi:hypothetical protein [Pseudobacteroides cellulosolvens]|uniref:Uncharacterized protein n=1 Tax=Pseudobacteroides cellulosolvens ATCC 35603 = DSM 2933 TaxID=398512 RepID=A0A0L6JX68_9FIRM|nr:hypothetical protein [Pseudobacteroides cellulosolvens]KNY30443.1 hypothetical protein Bccel_5723 [Pseudobacteroides cellulosolvens ATCC 35603 = DSM 2933]
MKFQYIYIFIGLGSLIINIILLILYFKLNFSGKPRKSEKKLDEDSVFEVNKHSTLDPFENTAVVYEFENTNSVENKIMK